MALFSRAQQVDNNADMEIETVSMQPLILSIRNFLKPNECDWIISHAASGMMESPVSLMERNFGCLRFLGELVDGTELEVVI